jgi:hypothetical protein
VLDTADISAYMKRCDPWKDAKGNPMLKKEQLQGLIEIFKHTVYIHKIATHVSIN